MGWPFSGWFLKGRLEGPLDKKPICCGFFLLLGQEWGEVFLARLVRDLVMVRSYSMRYRRGGVATWGEAQLLGVAVQVLVTQ